MYSIRLDGGSGSCCAPKRLCSVHPFVTSLYGRDDDLGHWDYQVTLTDRATSLSFAARASNAWAVRRSPRARKVRAREAVTADRCRS